MLKHLISYTKRILKDQRGFFGNLFSRPEPEVQNVIPPMSPQQQQLWDLGQGYLAGGFPEFTNLASQQWRTETFPGIQELYEARRGLGRGSTPEVLGAQRQQGLTAARAAAQQAQARNQLMGILGGIAPRGTAVVGGQNASPFENFMNVAGPLAGSVAGGMFGGPFGAMAGGQLGSMAGGLLGTAGTNIAPSLGFGEDPSGQFTQKNLLDQLAGLIRG